MLVVVGVFAGGLLAVLSVVGWGLILTRLIHYGHGFNVGATPPTQKWTPIQAFVMLCTSASVAPPILAIMAVQKLKKNKALRSWISRMRGQHSPHDESKHGPPRGHDPLE